MQEIKTVIVLAAGSSRRMGELTKNAPKSLLQYRDQSILKRLMQQLKKSNVEKVILVIGYLKDKIKAELQNIEGIEIQFVENDLYDQDVNIYSMKLALDAVNESVVIFEADTVMEDALVTYVTGSDFEGKSVWFTNGRFNSTQYGGILNSDKFGNITNIKIVPEYKDEYSNYSKLTGLMRIHAKEIPKFKELVNDYLKKTMKQYYLVPWIENLQQLPCIEGNVEHYLFKTFNTAGEYTVVTNTNLDFNNPKEEEIKMIHPKTLKHIEKFDGDRVQQLKEKITREKVWTKPLYVEKNHNLVLDGQHRLQVALSLGLTQVPVQAFNYDEVKVWTLRKEEEVSVPRVIERANAGNIYPYKTVKHKFPNVIGDCAIPLDKLKEPNEDMGL
jgi:L-serine kinase (ADP)